MDQGNCLLVTEKFGSAIRISSLLTQVPLCCEEPVNRPPLRSLPNLCKQCPAGALKGTLWQLGTPRSEIVDVEKCYRKQVEILTAQISRQEDLCRKCFAVCSYTQRYLRQTDEE